MKKGAMFLSIFLAVILFSFAITAQGSEECEAGDQNCKINLAKSCLDDLVEDCDFLTASDDKVFYLLGTGQCSDEVEDDSKFEEEIKYTSQAILGLTGSARTDAREWLLDQNKTSEGLAWHLQIDIPTFPEGDTQASCEVDGPGSAITVIVNEDKTVSGNGGCVSGLAGPPGSGNYWFTINPSCYGEEIEISCDEAFTTSLIYTASGSDTVYVVDESPSSGSADGETTEIVNSQCFKATEGSGACNYEATLWGALALDSLKEDVTPFLPYLTSLRESNANTQFLPEAFLQSMTDAFKVELLEKQINDESWSVSGNSYFGTALALYPFRVGETPSEKTNSINWLLDRQTIDGCWNKKNIRDTAFILYSVFPGSTSSSSGGGVSLPACEASGYFCRSSFGCTTDGGSVLTDYSCTSGSICCSTQATTLTCSEQSGAICSTGQQCSGTRKDSAGLGTGEICCIGTCTTPSTDTQNACETGGGSCKSSCSSSESETFLACDFQADRCCLPSASSSGAGIIWIVLLVALIGLAVAGIIFRDKVRAIFFRLKSNFGKGSSSSTSSQQGYPRRPPFHPPQHPQARPQQRRGEFDDVLKKLKEMGK